MKKIINILILFSTVMYNSWLYVIKEVKDLCVLIYLLIYTKINNIFKKKNNSLSNLELITLPNTVITTQPAKKSFVKSLFIFGLQCIAVGFGVFILLIIYVIIDAPNYKTIENYEPALSTRIYASDGALISEFSKEKRLLVPINDIPVFVKQSFVSAEDKTFYSHSGFDFTGIARATINNVKYIFGASNNLEGASTISQQVAKNFFLDSRRTIIRKLKEAYITIQIERLYSKEYILELYLNEIYLGRGSYGVAMAALNYFNKSINQLTIEEGAFLAAIPKAPSRYDPKFNYNLSKDRRDWVIGRMLEDDKITVTQAQEAINKPINVIDNNVLQSSTSINSYAAEEIRKDLLKNISSYDIYNGGLIIKTTINNTYQKYTYKVLREGLEKFDTNLGYRAPVYRYSTIYNSQQLLATNNSGYFWMQLLKTNSFINKYRYAIDPWRLGMVLKVEKDVINVGLFTGEVINVNLSNNNWVKPANTEEQPNFNLILQPSDIVFVEKDAKNNWLLKQVPEVNGAMVVLNIHTGDVLAMQGGYSFIFSEFNRATQANRQLGSAFKPLVYLAAIMKGATPADIVLDAPYVHDNGDNVWRPKNDNNSYRGYITLRQALEWSVNLATIRVADSIGLNPISKLAVDLGIYNDNLDNFSQALGSKETTLLKAVTAYAIMGNGGKEVKPNLIHLVQNRFGNVIYKKSSIDCNNCAALEWRGQLPTELPDNRKQIISPQDSYVITNMMKGVIDRGTGRSAKLLQYDIAGKTGTTNDVKDTWFIAFTADIVVGVYFGYDSPKSLGSSASSVSIAVPIVRNFFNLIINNYKPQPFRTPNGIEMRWVSYKDGTASNSNKEGAILESFRSDMPNQSNIIINHQGQTDEPDVNFIY